MYATELRPNRPPELTRTPFLHDQPKKPGDAVISSPLSFTVILLLVDRNTSFAKALYGLSVPEAAIRETEQIFKDVAQVGTVLGNPLVFLKEKEQVIDRIFPQEMRNFLKTACKYQKIGCFQKIMEAYGE